MQFYLQKMKLLQKTTQTLTHDNQDLRLTINIQIELPGLILQGFIKLRNQICKLNYKRTKSVIEDKMRNQFYNFAF